MINHWPMFRPTSITEWISITSHKPQQTTHIAYAPIYTPKDNKSVLKNTIRTTQIRTCSGFSPRQDIKYHNSGRTTHTKKHVVSLTQLVCYAVKNLPACVVDVSVNICHCQSPLNKGWPWRHSIYNFFTFAKFLSIT